MGTDFFAPIGTPVYSNIQGQVTRISTDGNYGLRVEIKGADGNTYELAHLDATNLQVGSNVDSGTLVAYTGNSGNAIDTLPHTHAEVRPGDGSGTGPYGTANIEGINPATGQPYKNAFSYNEPGSALADVRGTTQKGQAVDGYIPQRGAAFTYDTTTPTAVSSVEGDYKYYGTDEGGKYYVSADGKTSLQYDNEAKTWTKYDADTGEPLASQGVVPSAADNTNVPTPSAGGAMAGAAAPGAATAAGAAGQAIGGAGCLSGGLSAAGAAAAGGILGNLGGLAQGAAMSAGMALLSGGGLQGAMGAALGSVAGALGNSLGAALGGVAGSLGSTLGGIAGQALGGAVGAVVAGQNPLQALSGAAFGAISQMGGALIPGLSNVMPAGIASAAIGGLTGVLGAVARGAPPGAMAQFALAGGLGGALNGVISNMTGNLTLGAISGAVATGALNGSLAAISSQASGQINLARYANLIHVASAVTSQNRNIVGSVAEAMSQSFGNGVGGVGAATRNMQDAMTFSVSTLGQNIPAIATDMIAMGTWETTNLMRLMQPGNVATQILFKGLGDYTGLNNAFISAGIPIAGLDNPIYDRVTLAVLSTIDDPEAISTIKTAFNMTAKFTNLAQLCDIQTMMPNSVSYLPVNNFRELGVHLAVIGINAASNMMQIGIAFSKVEISTDLNHISQLAQPLPDHVGTQLMQVFGYGGGSFGEQTMADLIGTPAGYVHTDTIPVIVETNKFIEAHPEAKTLVILTNLFKNTAEGLYTDLGTPGVAEGDPGDPGGITIPFPAGSQSFSTLDDALLAFVPLIEAEHQALLNTTDPVLLDNINKLNTAWAASCAQIVKENNNLKAHNIDLFNPLPVTPNSAIMFAQMLDQYAMQTGYGQAAHYLERVATNDMYGDAIKYCMRQARNAAALQDLGINPEKYKLPQSQYYRDPSLFYENLYTGKMPPKPQFQSTTVYPRTPQDTYIYNRNQAIDMMGLKDVPLLNNQKDEMYYDSIWANTDQSVLESIGRNAVKNAIDLNITIDGNDLMMADGKGGKVKFGEIKNNGLMLTNNDYFVIQMMNAVNKLLYGNLQTTKYTNPFNTDQMVYGVLELLAQVTDQNIDSLLQTITGGLIASGLLAELMTHFGTRRSLFDTGMDRNDPAAWGGVGPDAVPDRRPRLL